MSYFCVVPIKEISPVKVAFSWKSSLFDLSALSTIPWRPRAPGVHWIETAHYSSTKARRGFTMPAGSSAHLLCGLGSVSTLAGARMVQSWFTVGSRSIVCGTLIAKDKWSTSQTASERWADGSFILFAWLRGLQPPSLRALTVLSALGPGDECACSFRVRS